MKTCVVKNIKIGEGKPKICLPVVGKTNEEILQQISSFSSYIYDFIELRIDFYENIFDSSKVISLLKEITKIMNKPILFTYRSLKEGGQVQLSDDEYVRLIETACCSDVDMIDVEVMSGNQLVYQLVEMIHKNNKKVILSYHDFTSTPNDLEIKSVLEKMEILNGDILKIAVMPQTYKDVIHLLNVTMEMSEKLNKPLITMSMGHLGKISRLIGELTGSCVTFASAGKSSAPGQVDVEDINMILEAIHND
ncbi:MAG: type I 3-dehydroquinate dehydratase [Erysipelotrichales bacterium]|nr:type I 3-dehydroquinate dehydratase [Erysipelotrichales bacterium]